MLEELEGEKPGMALKALSGMAVRVTDLGKNRSQENARFEQMHCLTESIGGHIGQMKVSLKDVGSLAVNSKIAAAGIRVPGTDFTSFADEIGRTLQLTQTTLNQFGAELLIVRQHVAVAQTGQHTFDRRQQEAAGSITDRLSATVKSIALEHKRAARASLEVRMGSARVHQRVCDAILALQIGDITRQRLEHADAVLGLVAGNPMLDADDQRTLVNLVQRLQSAQLVDAARNFDRDVRQVIESLNSLADEARALRTIGDAAYGGADRNDGSFIAQLEGQIGEGLALFESFETARAEVADVTATVSDATAGLCGHLRTVQSLEADIRIMGLNTTFKCARIGREGLALSIIAQELRGYANGFAKAAGTLMQEVETVAGISGLLTSGIAADQGAATAEGTRAMRDSLGTLRQMGQMLDRAMQELKLDSDRVVTLLVETVSNLAVQAEIGQVLRDAAEQLTGSSPSGVVDFAELPLGVVQKLELIERGYTMANERAVHDRFLGRPVRAEPVVETASGAAVEDFLF
jgi:predicted transcriptional regulator